MHNATLILKATSLLNRKRLTQKRLFPASKMKAVETLFRYLSLSYRKTNLYLAISTDFNMGKIKNPSMKDFLNISLKKTSLKNDSDRRRYSRAYLYKYMNISTIK